MIIEGEWHPDYILWKTSVFFGKSMKGSPLAPTIFWKIDIRQKGRQKQTALEFRCPRNGDGNFQVTSGGDTLS
jgi:hypothetical protein